MLTSRQVRQQFIDYFVQRQGHAFVPSSPVVPHDDPTLLFANAGMNQFKDVFLGAGRRDYRRAVNTQKCIRAGGKHNDLEDVGHDTYHHTFFEMLGNWSFGDYFKREAVDWAWDLLVNVWKIDARRLHATYFGGDPAHGLQPDDEARQLWLSHLPTDRVHPGSMKDNFWEMGDTGPCGPCSEIHIDLTADRSGGKLVNAGDPRVMEIWNLVFIQFNRQADGSLTTLPAKHVDTGMGFERLCRVLQGKTSNYDTDVFEPIFRAITQVTAARPYAGGLDDPVDIAYRVIADHIRCLSFAITDGAAPSNEGRGYVLRRILRRAVRHGRQTLGVKEPFFHRLVPAVVDAMGEAFPELRANPQRVAEVIRDEEESFGRTLDRGIELFEDAAGRAGTSRDRRAAACITAADAFKLYDTYGFPLDLTQVMAQERGMAVDVEGFERLMEEQRQRARASATGGVDITGELATLVQRQSLPATRFVGYDSLACDARVLGFFALNHFTCLVTDQTPFYAQAGGQVGDVGVITGPGGARFMVSDTLKAADVTFHIGQQESGSFAAGLQVHMHVDAPRRQRIMANHTATHVMNHKLRAVLGEHVQQRGSLVDPDKTRFDLSHPQAIQDQELARIEEMVNADIAADLPVHAGPAKQEEALKIHGLRAVFGEKYPPTVRVVSIGVPVADLLRSPAEQQWRDYSVEFCGGTHVASTVEIGQFVIVSEEAVGKGVRRLTALTGAAAQDAVEVGRELHQQADALASLADGELAAAVAELMQALLSAAAPLTVVTGIRARLSQAQQRLKDLDKQKSKASAGAAVEHARQLADEADGDLIVAEVPGADADALRSAMDVIRKKKPDAALLLAGAGAPDKVAFVAAVPPALVQKGLKAGDWVKHAAGVAGGGGGGRPDMAQAGGKDASKLAEALQAARQFATEKLAGRGA